ncbi:early nodulin-like protein 16 [Actinidia rufa]|uniref:Early nodulin-like protein 16 n=1 Tax=Actinidia rufa TaxID=165716 RepID=A0A7J0DCQ2_9ERIC|nr:early nodulin-like protein 16 [Actinidia rufa]
MERLRRGIATPVAVVVLACAVLVMIPQVLSVRYIVGSGMGGWNTNVNYTIWAQDKHFYNGDWLFFVYDRNQMNVLEVNKTDYEIVYRIILFTTGQLEPDGTWFLLM